MPIASNGCQVTGDDFKRCALCKRTGAQGPQGRRASVRRHAKLGGHLIVIARSPPKAAYKIAQRAHLRKPPFERRWRGAPEDRSGAKRHNFSRKQRIVNDSFCSYRFFAFTRNYGAVKKLFTLSRSFYVKSRGELPRRTPVVFHSLSSPWKKENETRERGRRQIEIFLSSGVLGCLRNH